MSARIAVSVWAYLTSLVGTLGIGFAVGRFVERRARWRPGDPKDPSVVTYVRLPNGLFRIRAWHVLAAARERVQADQDGGHREIGAAHWQEAQEKIEGAVGIPLLWDWKSGRWKP